MRHAYLLLATLPLFAGPAEAAPRGAAVPQVMQSCDAHKFETVVTATVNGQPEQKKVKLCGVEGQSDRDWIKTLRDAIAKLDANKQMEPAVRNQIETAIRAEIARLTITGVVSRPVGSAVASSPQQAPLLSRDYSSLPPLPGPDAPAATAQKAPDLQSPLRPLRPATATAPAEQEFAQLPPLPTAPPPPPQLLKSSSTGPSMPAPRLTFGCDTPGDLSSDAPCAAFERETMLTVHAGQDVPAAIYLQFVRNDEPRAEVPLAGLRRGASVRMPLPAKVCTGFTDGKLELRVVKGDGSGAMEPLKSDGPYSLRC